MTKLCIDCNHCYLSEDSAGEIIYSCRLPTSNISLITGRLQPDVDTCNSRRMSSGGKCGIEGKLFEPKRGD